MMLSVDLLVNSGFVFREVEDGLFRLRTIVQVSALYSWNPRYSTAGTVYVRPAPYG